MFQTSRSFLAEYRRRLTLPSYQGLEELAVAGIAYDAIWSIALGLDRVINRVMENNDSGCETLTGELVPLEMFNYTNQKMGCILTQSMEEIQFAGITVSYSAVAFFHEYSQHNAIDIKNALAFASVLYMVSKPIVIINNVCISLILLLHLCTLVYRGQSRMIQMVLGCSVLSIFNNIEY